MQQPLLLTVLLNQQSSGMDCISGEAFGYEDALVGGELYIVTNSAVDGALKHLHAMTQEFNPPVIRAAAGATYLLPDW